MKKLEFEWDPNKDKEERFLIIGRISNLNICVVSHCYKEKESIIRLISARRATKKEKETYERW